MGNIKLSELPDDYRVELENSFQKDIFHKVRRQYETNELCGKRLGISGAYLGEYRKGNVKTIRADILKKIVKMLRIDEDELKETIVNILSKNELSTKSLEKVNKRWKELKREVNLMNCLLSDGQELIFDLKRWLVESNYIERIKNVPAIINILNIDLEESLIWITYDYYNPHKGKREVFKRCIPELLKIDSDLMYFLGLWCGDRFRVGISNSCVTLLEFTAQFLTNKLKQPKSLILGEVLSSRELSETEWEKHDDVLRSIGAQKIRNRVDKRRFVKRKVISYAVLLSNNFILWHVLKSFENNLDVLFGNVSQDLRCAFYAGFFDAEGHVNKCHQRFEWHQYPKNHGQIIGPVIKYLKKDGFSVYYGKKMICVANKVTERSKDFQIFKSAILPFVKHPDKVIDANDLLSGNQVKRQYVVLGYWIYKNPDKTSKELSQDFNQNITHMQSKLRSMINEGLLAREREGNMRTYSITENGKGWVNKNGVLLNHILTEVKEYGSWSRHMYVKDGPAMKELLKNPVSTLIF